MKAYLVDHEEDNFEDEIMDPLNRDNDLRLVWAKYDQFKRSKSQILAISYIFPKLEEERSGIVDRIFSRIQYVNLIMLVVVIVIKVFVHAIMSKATPLCGRKRDYMVMTRAMR